MAAILALGVVRHVSNHGQSLGQYDGPGAFIAACVSAGILWWGGFWG
ncbi:MAG: hypothetical protein WDN25_03820 [Acetobacteraceae bacterium]